MQKNINMKKAIFFVLMIILASGSFQQQKVITIEGDLYFKLIDFRFFEGPDSFLDQFEDEISSVSLDTLLGEEKKLYQLLKFMGKENLLRKPFFLLRLDNKEIARVFLDSMEYRQIKGFNHMDLSNKNRRVRIKAMVSKIENSDSLMFYQTIKLLSVKEIRGKTYWDK